MHSQLPHLLVSNIFNINSTLVKLYYLADFNSGKTYDFDYIFPFSNIFPLSWRDNYQLLMSLHCGLVTGSTKTMTDDDAISSTFSCNSPRSVSIKQAAMRPTWIVW